MLSNQLLVENSQGHYAPATIDQVFEAARDAMQHKFHRGTAFTTPGAVKDYLWVQMVNYEHEVFVALFLDNQHRLIACIELFRGTIDQAVVYPREVVKEALRVNAAAVIFSHNHPSGSPTPSEADKRLTHRLVQAMGSVDIRVLDHIIVAGTETASFAEQGLI